MGWVPGRTRNKSGLPRRRCYSENTNRSIPKLPSLTHNHFKGKYLNNDCVFASHKKLIACRERFWVLLFWLFLKNRVFKLFYMF